MSIFFLSGILCSLSLKAYCRLIRGFFLEKILKTHVSIMMHLVFLLVFRFHCRLSVGFRMTLHKGTNTKSKVINFKIVF